jgi:hypothetical protein
LLRGGGLSQAGNATFPAVSRPQGVSGRGGEARLAEREVRSYEAEYVNSLWHWDFHHASRKVLTPRGEWQTPLLLGTRLSA